MKSDISPYRSFFVCNVLIQMIAGAYIGPAKDQC